MCHSSIIFMAQSYGEVSATWLQILWIKACSSEKMCTFVSFNEKKDDK
jgi:hypothetical protein